jgi:hypothetical protein
MIAVAKKFMVHVVPSIIRPLRILWNELIGFVFIVLAIGGLASLYRTLKNYNGDSKGFFTLILVSFFVLMMLFYGVFSFVRARRISRS